MFQTQVHKTTRGQKEGREKDQSEYPETLLMTTLQQGEIGSAAATEGNEVDGSRRLRPLHGAPIAAFNLF